MPAIIEMPNRILVVVVDAANVCVTNAATSVRPLIAVSEELAHARAKR